MADDSYEEREKLLLRKHELELENLKVRRKKAELNRRSSPLSSVVTMNLLPDPLDIEEAELRERQSKELLALIEEKMSAAKVKVDDPERLDKRRFTGTIMSRSAVRKLEEFIESKGIGFNEFAIQAGTTDRTIRSFRKTGKVRRDIFQNIARVIGLKPEDLLK